MLFRSRGAVDNDLDTILARGQDGVEIVVDTKVAAARPVGAARSQPTGQPGREAETKS